MIYHKDTKEAKSFFDRIYRMNRIQIWIPFL